MKTARDRILAKLRAAPVQPPVEPDVAGYYAHLISYFTSVS